MFLSDTAIKRPVFAAVINLLIIAFGLVSFTKLPLREYPDVDPPIVSISTTYRGASANVIETRITELIEERIAGVEGIKNITSSSEDGVSNITVEFEIERDIDDAANDLRDRVSGVLSNLPEEADAPEVKKADANDDVIVWFSLNGEGMSIMQLTDYARRYVQDSFSSLDGVARVRIGGSQEMAMRIWLDSDELAARKLTVDDVENAIRQQNVELPAGSLESVTRDFTVRMTRNFNDVEDFRGLVIRRGDDGYLVRLGDVANIELAPVERRALLRGNGVTMVGIGIIKQSKANTLEVARAAKDMMAKINKTLPNGMSMEVRYDTSVFIEGAVHEVYKTLFIAIILVVGVIYIFLGNARATFVPAITVPVSLIGTFMVMLMLGYTINIFTLLALILAIGLVVDDAIVVIENIHRRTELGEPKLIAAYRGTRQVGFAVVATTVVLAVVFLPINFLEGMVGRLFREFAVTMATAVLFSGFCALTLSPMLSSKLLEANSGHNKLTKIVDGFFEKLKVKYLSGLNKALKNSKISVFVLAAMFALVIFFFKNVKSEFTPKEDRGAFFLMMRGPEGSSYDYILEHLNEVEKRLQPFIKTGEFQSLLLRAPGSFTSTASFNDAIVVAVLSDWNTGRKPIWYYVNKTRELVSDIPGVLMFPVVRQALGGMMSKPVQIVIGGDTYQDLVKWRDIVIAKAQENKNLIGLDSDFLETKPQLGVKVDVNRAGDMGIPVSVINRALETTLGSRRVTTFIDRGQEYDVILESKKDMKTNPMDITGTYVRSTRTSELIPLSNLVTISEFADAAKLPRYNRLRSITIEANLADGYTVGEALTYLENIIKTELPPTAHIDYKGESLRYKESGSSVYFIFLLALVVVFLVLAGQFESFIHPLVIMFTVPLAMSGALFSLWVTGLTLNIYSQIGLIILVGISAKNGILIVEFINQLRDEGVAFRDAILEASGKRLRPIVMTCITTAMGAVPLIIATGAGAETRMVIGVVIFTGVMIAMIFTIFIIPVMYQLLAKNTTSPETTSRKLEAMLQEYKDVN